MENYICDCCGHKTLTEPKKSYEICPVCFWQDDGYIDYEGYYDTGANHIILSVAQKNYKDIGACDKRCLEYVRKPKCDEQYVGELKEYKERSYGIVIENCREFEYYTDMDKVFSYIENIALNYNWLITDIECNIDTDFFSYPWQNKYYGGKELLDHLKKQKIQFIWGVFTAIPKECNLTKEELLELCSPTTNGEVWGENAKIQHPLGDIEIVAWDSCSTVVIVKDYKMLNQFKKRLSWVYDFEEY